MTPRGERPWLDAIAHIEAGGEGYDVVLMVVPPGLQDSVQVELSALLRPSGALCLTLGDDGRGAYGNLGGTLLAWRQAQAALGDTGDLRVLLVHDAGAARRTGLLSVALPSRGSLPLPGGRSLRTQVLRAGLPLSASCRPGQVDVLWGGQIVLPTCDPLSIGVPAAELVKLSRAPEAPPGPDELRDLGWIRGEGGRIEAFARQGTFPDAEAWSAWSGGAAVADLGSFRVRAAVLDAWAAAWTGEKIDLDPDLLGPLVAGAAGGAGAALLAARRPTVGVSALGAAVRWWRFRRPTEVHTSLCEMLDDAHGRALLGLSARPGGDDPAQGFSLGPDITLDPDRLRVRSPGGAWLEAPLAEAGERWTGGAALAEAQVAHGEGPDATPPLADAVAEVTAAGPPGSAWSGLAGLVDLGLQPVAGLPGTTTLGPVPFTHPPRDDARAQPRIAVRGGATSGRALLDDLRGLLQPGAAPIAGPHPWRPLPGPIDPARLVWRDPRTDLDASALARGLAALPLRPPGDAVGLLAWARARLILDGWDQPALSRRLHRADIAPAALAQGFVHLGEQGWFPDPGPWPGEPGRRDPLGPVATTLAELTGSLGSLGSLGDAAVIGLVGPAGAGKTTTSRLLAAAFARQGPVRRIDGDPLTRPGPGLRFVVRAGRRQSFLRGPAIYDEPALRDSIREARAEGPGIVLLDHVFLGLDPETRALLDRLILVDPGDTALRIRRKLARDRADPRREDDLATDLCLKAYEEVAETWPWLAPDVVWRAGPAEEAP